MNKFITIFIILFFIGCGGGFDQDVTGPEINLLYPSKGFIASDSIEIRYNVSDNSRIIKMILRLNGYQDTLMNSDEFSPNIYYHMLDVTSFESGRITIQGVSEDEFGNVGESPEIEIFVDNSLKFVNIPSSIFIDSGNQETELLYDYQLMTYPVTIGQYLVFLNEADESEILTITANKIKGYVSIDENLNEFISYGNSSSVHNIGAISIENNQFIAIDSSYIHHPITGVTLYGAIAFAEYYSMRLPTVLEWEKAARGMNGYFYPWSNYNDASHSNFYESGDPWEPGTTPVGYYNGINNGTNDSPSPYGAYDMAGNVWEWTSDINSIGKFILKGGSYLNPDDSQTTENEHDSYPIYGLPNYGFRCARDL